LGTLEHRPYTTCREAETGTCVVVARLESEQNKKAFKVPLLSTKYFKKINNCKKKEKQCLRQINHNLALLAFRANAPTCAINCGQFRHSVSGLIFERKHKFFIETLRAL